MAMKNVMGIIYTGERDSYLRELTLMRAIAALPVAGRYRVIDFLVSGLVNSGVKNVDTLLIKVAVSFKASWWFTMKNVVLPAALPMIFAGLRIAAGTALLLLVAAEMIAAEQGIGALILHYGDLMITERLMAGVIVLSLLGLVFSLTLEWLERRFVPWQRKN